MEILLHKTLRRSPAVARIADCTDCQWLWRSSKIHDFHLIWKGVCYYILVINSNLRLILHRLATVARTDLQGHPRLMISILSEKAYATSYWWLIITLVPSLTVAEIWPLIAWNFLVNIAAKPLQMGYYWQPIGSRQCPIQWYHRRSPTIYRLATIPHNWHSALWLFKVI